MTQDPPVPLSVVATPIGNLEDLSPRARASLGGADVIACEDTRRTGRLLELTGVGRRRLLRLDDHTEAATAAEIIRRLSAGEHVVLVTDAGTPGIADPGQRLVRAVLDAGLPVTVVPGPSAPLAALVASGLSTARFVFEGFLPRRGEGRRDRLGELATERRTVVLLESPHRLAATLAELLEVCGPDREVAVARELTKLHEEVRRGPLGQVAAGVDETVRGEVVVVLGPAPPPDPASDADIGQALRRQLRHGGSRRDAVARVAADLGVSRRRVYELALQDVPDDPC
jgi:16S rRNA (cytidine1402-2'-O)-methyltransferase